MIAFTAVVLVVDGGQGIMAYALRGRQDVWIPCGMQIFAFFGVMIPVVYLLVFMGDQGAIGWPRQVGDDEADTGNQFAGMPFHLGHHAPISVPASSLIAWGEDRSSVTRCRPCGGYVSHTTSHWDVSKICSQMSRPLG